jgi:hypothetical protein
MTHIDIYLDSGTIMTVEGEWESKRFSFSSAYYENQDITDVIKMSPEIVKVIEERAYQQCVEREYARAEFIKELSKEQPEEWSYE